MPHSHFSELCHGSPDNTLSLPELWLRAISLLAIVLMVRPSDMAPIVRHFERVGCSAEMIQFITDHLVFNQDGSMTISAFV